LRTHPVGERDLVVASVAVTHEITLVTHSHREFARMSGLPLEDWTTSS